MSDTADRSPRRGRSAAHVAMAFWLAFGAGAAPAAEKGQDPARPPLVDARADALLKAMGEYLSDAGQLAFSARLDWEDVLPSGQKIEYGALQEVAVRRPNRVYVESLGDAGAHRLWYDGKQITLLDGVENVYAVAPMPGRIEQAVERMIDQYDFAAPLSDFLYPNPYEILRKRVQFGVYVGTTDIDGMRCHHLAFVEQEIDWQIWIRDGAEMVPCRLVITYTQVPNQPRFAATFTDWQLDPRIADARFVPMLPPDAGRVDLLEIGKEIKEGGK